ncbi:MAG: heparinase II/III family protein [bacterium]|nr:heparinase II/III family protein [bacterium]
MPSLLEAIVENHRALEKAAGTKPALDPKVSHRWASALKAGIVLFYDHREVQVGHRNIDWTGKHVAHQEWPAQLNRFFWLEHLAAVYRETGDEELPAIARATIEDWMDQHTYRAEDPPGPGDNTLNVSIRMGQGVMPGWWGTVPAFAKSPHYDEAFLQRMLESSQGQLACLAAHLTPTGNWRISHLDCLLFCGLLVPGLEEHVPFAVRHLNETFHRQIHSDGSHEEHNPSYHSWMCNLFTRLWRLSQARPDAGLQIDTRRAARMWDYLVCSAAPDGGPCGLHDGGSWTPGPGHIPTIKTRQAFLEEAGLADDPEFDLNQQPSRYFSSAGQLFLRESWAADATFLTFDATRWGGGHCHLSRLSVNLYAGNRMLLCDPGVFSYEMSDPYAPHGKSTRAHNTLNIGGLNQTEANPDTRTVHIQDDLSVIASRYAGGYFPGEYTWGWSNGKGTGTFGIHDRVLLWLKGRAALVFDLLSTDGKGQPYAAHWQFPSGPCTLDEKRRAAWTGSVDTNLLIQSLHASDDLSFTIHEGEKDPLLGWLPDQKREYHPAPLFAMAGSAQRSTSSLVTLLLPFQGATPPEVNIEPLSPERSGFLFTWPDGTQHIVAATPALHTQVGRTGPIDTDGSLAVITLNNGEPTRSFLLDGLFLEYEDHRLIDKSISGVHSS